MLYHPPVFVQKFIGGSIAKLLWLNKAIEVPSILILFENYFLLMLFILHSIYYQTTQLLKIKLYLS